ncbi:hypothetical protein B0T25DRAFT_71257 [Lasiosphaeria hispida]|uniref:Zn(2)-C6 fungal-type domain-containing protein n=1 Tax=Lasiosphaeria hispida TaxID=260671 RepID=A0AAJ0MLD6_9PEZI|nr:hypothetical protein B0T25DRAFT_71257 [Lasiosphaeria hispida]
MAPTLETKACLACAKSKRKCGKQVPSCDRCSIRQADCKYPPSRPTCWVVSDYMNTPSTAPTRTKGSQGPQPPLTSSWHSVTITDLQSAWFLTPDTWVISPVHTSDFIAMFLPPSAPFLQRSIKHLHLSITDWVAKGRSALIHSQLYADNLPRPIQDAYTTLSTYLTRTPQTDHIVQRIIASRLDQLTHDAPPTSLRAHIARVHALLVYLTLGLFSPSPTLRAHSSTHLPLLTSWSAAMLTTAAHAAATGTLLPPAPACPATALWHAWILAETVRRTWMLASSVKAVYCMMADGGLQCAGGLMFTTRSGVWDAVSAWEWMGVCAAGDVGFMEAGQTQRLLWERRPEEVDCFGRFMLEATFGAESMVKWGVKIEELDDIH